MSNNKFQVFVSSTFEDLKEERSEILQTLLDLNCIPAGMEYFPATDDDKFEYIKRVIDDSDYFILVLAGKYGSPGSDGIGYTEAEYNYAIQKEIPILAFLHSDIDNLPTKKVERDPEMISRLMNFRERAQKSRIARHWDDKKILRAEIATSLYQSFRNIPAKGWSRTDDISNKELLEENHKLRKQIDQIQQVTRNNSKQQSDFVSLIQTYIIHNTLPATVEDYKKWCAGYMKKGGRVSQYKTRHLREMRLVEKDIVIFPMYGILGMNLIVKPGVRVNNYGGPHTHVNIYYLENFSKEGHGEVEELEEDSEITNLQDSKV